MAAGETLRHIWDRPPLPPLRREFWQRAEARNANSAKLYDKLGLPEYQAIEGFVHCTPSDADQAVVEAKPAAAVKPIGRV